MFFLHLDPIDYWLEGQAPRPRTRKIRRWSEVGLGGIGCNLLFLYIILLQRFALPSSLVPLKNVFYTYVRVREKDVRKTRYRHRQSSTRGSRARRFGSRVDKRFRVTRARSSTRSSLERKSKGNGENGESSAHRTCCMAVWIWSLLPLRDSLIPAWKRRKTREHYPGKPGFLLSNILM